MIGCEVVIAVTLQFSKQGQLQAGRARQLPCHVVRANWQRWQREGRLRRVRVPSRSALLPPV